MAANFAAFGFSLGAWSGASAAIVARAGVSAIEFGVALTVFTVLHLAAMSGAGASAERIGARRALPAALLATGPALLFASSTGMRLTLAPSPFSSPPRRARPNSPPEAPPHEN